MKIAAPKLKNKRVVADKIAAPKLTNKRVVADESEPKCMDDMLDRQLAFPLKKSCRKTGGESCYIRQSTEKFDFVVGLSKSRTSNYKDLIQDAKEKAEAGVLKTKRDMVDYLAEHE